jgi:adsorption protein B
VRDALRAGIPSAGVGCAIARPMLDRLAALRGASAPFAAECLTEDYELGLGIATLGGRQRFLRFRDESGRLVATRACFPARLDHAVRQKTRWIHGIAFQGWDRLGWSARPSDMWMRLRDRQGPLTAIVLAAAYLLLLLAGIGWVVEQAGYGVPLAHSPLIDALLLANLASFAWRAAWRFAFTAREYGAGEGIRAVLRIPLANLIAIMAGRGAILAYVGVLAGQRLRWDKTEHDSHPALFGSECKT